MDAKHFVLNIKLPVELREAKQAAGLTWRQVILCGLSLSEKQDSVMDNTLETADMPQEGE